jgi:DNA repair ATPase RecN
MRLDDKRGGGENISPAGESSTPIKIPSYREILENSSFEKRGFSKEDYETYKEQLREDKDFLEEYQEMFRAILKNIERLLNRLESSDRNPDFDIDRARSKLKRVKELHSKFSRKIEAMSEQTELFSGSKDEFIVERDIRVIFYVT